MLKAYPMSANVGSRLPTPKTSSTLSMFPRLLYEAAALAVVKFRRYGFADAMPGLARGLIVAVFSAIGPNGFSWHDPTFGCIPMAMTFRVRFVIIAGLICGTLSAQDITGRWTCVADTTDEASTKRQEQQSFEIKSADGKLTAVSICRNGNRGAALQVQQDGAKINLYRFLDFEGGEPTILRVADDLGANRIRARS
jgi:VCBS repeat-containing protein